MNTKKLPNTADVLASSMFWSCYCDKAFPFYVVVCPDCGAYRYDGSTPLVVKVAKQYGDLNGGEVITKQQAALDFAYLRDAVEEDAMINSHLPVSEVIRAAERNADLATRRIREALLTLDAEEQAAEIYAWTAYYYAHLWFCLVKLTNLKKMPHSVFITSQAAADLINVSKRTIQKWCNAGTIPARKFGRDWLINPNDLLGVKRKPSRWDKRGTK